MSEFDEYIVHGEPGQSEKADKWQTAIGLHAKRQNDALETPFWACFPKSEVTLSAK